jgi:hypothetical protein
MIAYDPQVKSIKSAINKVLYRSINTKAKVRLLTDVYRASIIASSLDDVYRILTRIQTDETTFVITRINDSFKKPWADGYRDIQLNISDPDNDKILGELQIQLCPVKRFTEILGHYNYEVT